MSDGNGPSRGDNSVTLECGSRPQLCSDWSFQGQFNAIARCAGVEDDLTFKESSVKDVTDGSRAKCAAGLEQVLMDTLNRAPPAPAQQKRKAIEMGNINDVKQHKPQESVSELEKEMSYKVRKLLAQLQVLRQQGDSASCVGLLEELDELPVTVRCLKATKIAAELNLPWWRGREACREARELAASLVARWRREYRSETGTTAIVEVAKAPSARRCRNVSMDLEAAVYSSCQRVRDYGTLAGAVARLIERDATVASGLCTGARGPREIVEKVAAEVRLRIPRVRK